jgi:cyanophycin synthetase
MRLSKIPEYRFFRGANQFLSNRAVSFELPSVIASSDVSDFLPDVVRRFPTLEGRQLTTIRQLAAEMVLQFQSSGMQLCIDKYNISSKSPVIAVECLDEYVAKDSIEACLEWLLAIQAGETFDFNEVSQRLRSTFERTRYSGPTYYTLMEAARSRGIQVLHLPLEGRCQMGYGKRQVRFNSTIVHYDSVVDVELLDDKEDTKQFLKQFGFPVPRGDRCFTLEQAVDVARRVGWPVAVKPLVGHKGTGVTTNVAREYELRRAFDEARRARASEDDNTAVLVEEHVEGSDYRLLTVKGKFVAAVRREPASVICDGRSTIRELVEDANRSPRRKDDVRSALGKIRLDHKTDNALASLGLHIDSAPPKGRRVVLSTTANLSTGGTSFDVTRHVHPVNIRLVESIAAYIQVTCIGFDVIAKDISKPWTDGMLKILELNAGPGIFMHVNPAVPDPMQKPRDVAGDILSAIFEDGCGYIPIICGNRMTSQLSDEIHRLCRSIKPNVTYGSLTPDGLHVNGEFVTSRGTHDQQVMMLLRHNHIDVAVMNHSEPDIVEHGQVHNMSSVLILDRPTEIESVLLRDLREDGALLLVGDNSVELVRNGVLCQRVYCDNPNDGIMSLLNRILKDLLVESMPVHSDCNNISGDAAPSGSSVPPAEATLEGEAGKTVLIVANRRVEPVMDIYGCAIEPPAYILSEDPVGDRRLVIDVPIAEVKHWRSLTIHLGRGEHGEVTMWTESDMSILSVLAREGLVFGAGASGASGAPSPGSYATLLANIFNEGLRRTYANMEHDCPNVSPEAIAKATRSGGPHHDALEGFRRLFESKGPFSRTEIRAHHGAPVEALNKFGFAIMAAIALDDRGYVHGDPVNGGRSIVLSDTLDLSMGIKSKDVRIRFRKGARAHFPLSYACGDGKDDILASLALHFC